MATARALSHIVLLALTLACVSESAGAAPTPSTDVADASGSVLPDDWTPVAWGDGVASFTRGTSPPEGREVFRVDVTRAGTTGDARWESAPIPVPTGVTRHLISGRYRSGVETILTVLAEDSSGARRAYIDVGRLPAAAAWTEAREWVQVPRWTASLSILHRIDRLGWLETGHYAVAITPAAAVHPAIVSLAFDDGWLSAFAHLVPQVEAMGWRTTQYLASGFIDDPEYAQNHMGSGEVRALIERGHEIGSHGLKHDDLAGMGAAGVAAELEESRAALEALGARVTSFAPPYSSYTAAVRDRAMASYAAFRTALPGVERSPYRLGELRAVDVMYDRPLEAVEALLDEAERVPGGWLILIFHRASTQPTDTAETFITPEKFQALLEILKARRAVVKPVGEVLGLWAPSHRVSEGAETAAEVITAPRTDP